ncbi:MAG: peptidoglycan-binding domain-containing protein, partial [Candidatus Paceibacterota bacterium]
TNEPVNMSSDSCFIKTLGIKRGYFELANEEVKNLQIFLNQKGFYPENVTSGFFGIKTESALKAFQKANKINESGIIDDLTFKAICGYESNQSLYCPFVTENLSIGYFEEATNEVKTLQLILAKLGLLEEKNVTGYFGNITSEAVKALQTKGGITSTGVLDLTTRQALCKALDLPMKDSSNSNPYESSTSKVDVAISDLNVFPKDKIDVNTRLSIVVKIKNIGTEESKPMISSLYINDQEINKANINAIQPNDEVMAIIQN